MLSPDKYRPRLTHRVLQSMKYYNQHNTHQFGWVLPTCNIFHADLSHTNQTGADDGDI